MSRLTSRQPKGTPTRGERAASPPASLADDYFRIRDFEYVQPLYDLAFLLEVSALAEGTEVPKYRTFSLWRAGYSLDGYGTTIDRWLDGTARDEDLDYVPSARIRQYLTKIRRSGTIPELRQFRGERFDRCLRLRSVRGLGPNRIALTVSSRSLDEEWFSHAAINLALDGDRINELYRGGNLGPWQTAHVVPPLLRFLRRMQDCNGDILGWAISGLVDPFEPVTGPVSVVAKAEWDSSQDAIQKALRREKHFRRDSEPNGDGVRIRHQMGWSFSVQPNREDTMHRGISELANSLDPLASCAGGDLQSDLHLHTAWSDGSASVNTMATAVVASGLKHFAVTDHSRTSKLQGGLTPILWLRQANALSLATPVCPVLHGIEVDILKGGTLDLPHSLLKAADLVVASVHSNWTEDARANTNRLLKAIETGCIDILAHPTSAVIGKPGVPDYVREPADVAWDEIFERCALWRVALELNCFPSRLDLPLGLLRNAIEAGCAISIGSDAHARSHLLNLRFGEAALRRLEAPIVLNRFSYDELRDWIAESRKKRGSLTKSTSEFVQSALPFETDLYSNVPLLRARIQPPQSIPAGSRVVGIDLTAGDKATGIAVLDGLAVETCSLYSDDEILAYVGKQEPHIVSIDSPLGLPGGGDSIDPKAGIVRVAEHDLASIGIPAYPALIDSMRLLTQRGIRLRRAIEQSSRAPRVIESYPGAAQDILCIPRKQRSLDLLREGLRRLGLNGEGLETRSHDEMDAITSAIVGRYFEAGLFEPMGISREAQLIVPKIRPLVFDTNPVICLAGKTGAGKSVVARYLSVFYGFEWVRTRNIIHELLIDDLAAPPARRLFHRPVDPIAISEQDLRDFGAVVLDVHKQVPLRQRLTHTIQYCDVPVVVDSIRETVDVDSKAIGARPLLTWFVECPDAIIRQRLAVKHKLGEERIKSASPVDHTASAIRRNAHQIISNSGSLEELRWGIEDQLFAATILSAD
jgi:histidinol phosphatase-like PHP family hydrolase/predicted nuclease with RNAse H fold/dephospho-CoA kinase